MASLTRNPFGPFLDAHGLVVLDGGLATELEELGCDLNDPLWSAKVLVEAPDTIGTVVRRYLDAGADCVATATYQATFPGLAARGFSEEAIVDLLHDAVDLVAVALVDVETETRVGIATDLGRPTAQVRAALAGSDFLVLEANHDEVLLRTGPYPWSVKRRISSSHGHLSNEGAARLVRELYHPRLAGVLLAHLSNDCNSPELARTVVGRALDAVGYRGYLAVAEQAMPTPFLDIEELRRKTGPEQLTLL